VLELYILNTDAITEIKKSCIFCEFVTAQKVGEFKDSGSETTMANYKVGCGA